MVSNFTKNKKLSTRKRCSSKVFKAIEHSLYSFNIGSKNITH